MYKYTDDAEDDNVQNKLIDRKCLEKKRNFAVGRAVVQFRFEFVILRTLK